MLIAVRAIVLGNLGNLPARGAGGDEALRHYREALAIDREVGDRRSEGHVLGNLGSLGHEPGGMEEALAIAREVGGGSSQSVDPGAGAFAWARLARELK